MVETAYSALREVDVTLFMISADQKRGKGDDFIIERLRQKSTPVFLVINKIDKVHPDALLAIVKTTPHKWILLRSYRFPQQKAIISKR